MLLKREERKEKEEKESRNIYVGGKIGRGKWGKV